MQKLSFKPFERKILINKLKEAFPQYKIQDSLGNLQVRTSGFTVTGNVQLGLKPNKGEITTRTNLDMVWAYILFALPLGIYILSKKNKQLAFENEVAQQLREILEPTS
ncbi:MAG: hypothetical protein ACFB0B_16445 [Thermonemataceae bacterium]